ncbi:MAG: ABC transporter permease [Ruminococcus sp.]|nr:ABC transporter permease [Ruminococcus sp.]
MFLHQLKYDLLSMLRTKAVIIWLIIFPIVLGIFFKIAFGSAYEKEIAFSAIPAAVVMEEEDPYFEAAAKAVTEGDDPFMELTYVSEDEALSQLREGEVKGIIYAEGELRLSVSGSGTSETLLKAFTDRYNAQRTVIIEAAEKDPSSLPKVMEALSQEVAPAEKVSVTDGNTDLYNQFFFNLLAMVALYGSLLGLNITLYNQADLSPLAARKSCSAAHKSTGLLASLTGSMLAETACMMISVTFLRFVLKVDLGPHLGLVYLTAVIGGILGVAIGFFVGASNSFSFPAKIGISMVVSMLLCFLSGLMVGNMKPLIQQHCPIVNALNPAALISDSIYCLNICSDYRRFTIKIVTMLIMTAVLMILGLFCTRRKKYASL